MPTLHLEHGKASYPADHQPGMRVPKGGSSCQSCRFLEDAEERICGNADFIAWNGSEVIPAAVDSYCSDWYEPRKSVIGKAKERASAVGS